MIIESKTMRNVFYNFEDDTKIDFSSRHMQIMEDNVSRTCRIPIIYDGMYGIGDGTYMDVIPDWLGLVGLGVVRPKIAFCGESVKELHELTDGYENNPNTFVDIFDIVNSITFLVDEDNIAYQCDIEFDRELLINELGKCGITINPEDFTGSLRVNYEFDNFCEGYTITEETY